MRGVLAPFWADCRGVSRNRWFFHKQVLLSLTICTFKKHVFLILVFNWGIIALQRCASFCHTTTRVSRKCTDILSLVNLPPTTRIPPPRSPQGPELRPLFCMAASHQPCLTHADAHVNATLSIRPSLSFPCRVCESLLYVCVSVPALRTGSSVPPF